jgi:hypothetical protein
VLLMIIFQHFFYAVVAHQESITHIHFCHHRIIADNVFGLLDILTSTVISTRSLSWVILVKQMSFLFFHFKIIIFFSVCVIQVVNFRPCEISGSHVRESEDESLLGYSAVHYRWSRSTVQRCVQPPSCNDDGGSTHLWIVGILQ